MIFYSPYNIQTTAHFTIINYVLLLLIDRRHGIKKSSDTCNKLSAKSADILCPESQTPAGLMAEITDRTYQTNTGSVTNVTGSYIEYTCGF